ncbi:antirestriction protein ArdA [Herbaspirillum sp. RV1423]|uniref:antirestriction protein ArdA n=1 Tax=Herbaspirillum sp. RV1423 TaxID=1443993 RepID=UPI0004ACA20E|nr:antirestriction protein ArdA [Herbaspirillum sp. RV1423]
MSTYFAQPFNLDAIGFYFDTLDSYAEQSENLLDAHGNLVEEFEIQSADGDDCELFLVCGINQANLNTWFEDIVNLSDYEKTVLHYLLGVSGYSLKSALDKLDEVNLYEGNLKEVAERLFDEFYSSDVPESIRAYIDYEKFSHDCKLRGDMCEFEFNGKTWTCTN